MGTGDQDNESPNDHVQVVSDLKASVPERRTEAPKETEQVEVKPSAPGPAVPEEANQDQGLEQNEAEPSPPAPASGPVNEQLIVPEDPVQDEAAKNTSAARFASRMAFWGGTNWKRNLELAKKKQKQKRRELKERT